MKNMGLNEIRESFLAFFEARGHLRLPSFSLVPQNDPSVLLINAGMTPMKPYFTGAVLPPAPRVTTCQKCIRTPDIEQVGHTSRHGTYFEMLGNFSFGDYFKAEVIPWAWEYSTKVLELDPERIYVSVYLDDDEAYEIWHETVGLPDSHITRLGKPDNFWEHGTGPCGPCSELFYDRGEAYGCGKPDCGVGCDCDRYIEYWNLVFSQFDRQKDGCYLPLAQKNIDTGAGLERIACIVQGVDNLFEVDTVRALLDEVCRIADAAYGRDAAEDIAIRVITDHIRSTTMMISDGILPSNEGRGYVLRRLLRRAARYGRLLGIEGAFLCKLALIVIASSAAAYPQLREREHFILGVIEREEARFDQTIRQGQQLLDTYLNAVKNNGKGELDGEAAFRLHDTYGFPFDLTREIAAEQGLGVDSEGFKAAMRRQKEQARQATREKISTAWGADVLPEEVKKFGPTKFTGYEQLKDVAVLRLIMSADEAGDPVVLDEAVPGMAVSLLFEHSCFYANSGGQVGDRGLIKAASADDAADADVLVEIQDTSKTTEGVFLHYGVVRQGVLKQGANCRLAVDAKRRLATARNHTATHLLHRALRQNLGEHVTQAGSFVSPERLRFDFRHFQALTRAELSAVEAAVNAAILADYPVRTEVMSAQEAKNTGAMALFDEKYGDSVRVVSVGDYSKELCGGTHLAHSGQACYFKITAESSVASGVRRIEAVTGQGAFDHIAEDERTLASLVGELHVGHHELLEKTIQLQKTLKARDRTITQLEAKLAEGQLGALIERREELNGIRLLCGETKVRDGEMLREMAGRLRDRLSPAVVVLGSVVDENKVALIAMASQEAVTAGAHAGKLVKAAAALVGGGGGGRPDMAQAGGRKPENLSAALEEAAMLLKEQLKQRGRG